MEFGKIPVAAAKGAILGHSVSLTNGVLKKGIVLDQPDIALLVESEIDSVYAARLDDDDIGENAAASAIAKVLAGQGVRVATTTSGRANLFAIKAGVVDIDGDIINQLNRLDESLTVACLQPFERVEVGQMLATVKIIPYAVSKASMEAGLALVSNAYAGDPLVGGPLAGDPLVTDPLVGDSAPVAVRAFEKKRVGLIITRLAHTKQSVLDKTEQVMAERVQSMGSELGRISVVDHNANAVSLALNTLIPHHDVALVFGASAIVDRADVVPVAVLQVDGKIEHLGMPVDPGNLLLLAQIGDMPVIGVPTCARSLKRNGFDWVLERLLADITVTAADLQTMGVGGLLKEIPSRPHPRARVRERQE